MTTRTIEQELLDSEKQYWQAIKDQDVDRALDLTDEECIVAGAQGSARLDKKALSAMMRSSSYTLDRYQISDDAEVRLLTDDVAIVAYKVREELTVEGKPVTLYAADSSVWVRRDGQWVCALHTESILGDPYGRDRQSVQ